MEHCLVDGKRCTKCCEVLTMTESKGFRDWRKYVKRHGIPDDQPETKLHEMVRKISKRRAKKLNPDMVKIAGNRQSYFTCRHFKNSVCNNYENRPKTCSEYPYYGKTEKEWFESDEYLRGALYDKNCTFYIKVS